MSSASSNEFSILYLLGNNSSAVVEEEAGGCWTLTDVTSSPSSNETRDSGDYEPPPHFSKRRLVSVPKPFQRAHENAARERMRVHAIGAAFEALRRLVPGTQQLATRYASSRTVRLPKVAVLRIAAAYIETLTACLEALGDVHNDDEPQDLSKHSRLSRHCSVDRHRRFEACARRLTKIICSEVKNNGA